MHAPRTVILGLGGLLGHDANAKLAWLRAIRQIGLKLFAALWRLRTRPAPDGWQPARRGNDLRGR
jgi:hypothetical protein